MGYAYPGILKPSYSYIYNQPCTLKGKLIPHTNTTIKQAYWFRETHPHSGSESNMLIYSTGQTCKIIPTPLYTHKPIQTPTHLHTPSHGLLTHTGSYTSTVPMNRHTHTHTRRLHTQPHIFSCTYTPTLRARCLWTTGWVLSLPHQMLLQKSLLYIPKPYPCLPFFLVPGLKDPFPAANPWPSVPPNLHTQKPGSSPTVPSAQALG